ncbi:MAG: HAD family hydrolase [Chloroflexi bacterium]|nr:HAD family hydrolase [Chloroflexota bacterium]
MGAVKAVLFDLDDTLVPEMEPEGEALLIACGLAAEKYGVDPEAMSATVGEAAENLWAQWSTPGLYSSIAYSGWEGLWGPPDIPDDGLNDQENVIAYKRTAWDEVLAAHGIADTALRDEIIERHRIERIGRIRSTLGAQDVITELQADYLLAVVTNGSPKVQRFKLAKSGLAAYFGVVVVSGDVDVGKPNPLPFTTALNQLGIEARDAVMIGNSWGSDIQGAANLGMPSIWFNQDQASRPTRGEQPDAEIVYLAEIPSAIRQIAARQLNA